MDDAVRRFLAWESICAEKEPLGLTPQQVKQAENQKTAADSAVNSRLPETYQWLLVPTQATPQAAVTLQAIRLSGQGALAMRACKKLRGDELLVTSFAPTLLRMELDRVPLWRGNHVSIKQLVEDFARYLYLPRLADSTVLLSAIRNGVSLNTWEKDSFAFADSFDETAGRYRGLCIAQRINLPDTDAPGLIIKPEIARKQLNAEKTGAATEPDSPGAKSTTAGAASAVQGDDQEATSPEAAQPKRFHGTVTLDSTRVGRDASRIADEVIAHLSGLVGSDVRVTLEIEADIPFGAPDNVVRTVTENSRTLKFSSHGFEKE
jgi:hypothetical protein